MTKLRSIALLAACAVFGVGCGTATSGDQTDLIVTRDFGATEVAEGRGVPLTAGLTAMRQLQASSKVENSFGGRYVQSIDGVAEDSDSAWLFYVDGIESMTGATSVRLKAGQAVQWDFHPWQTVKGGGAIVGAYPQPMRRMKARMVCAPEGSKACVAAGERMTGAGVPIAPNGDVRVVVGPWSEIKDLDGVPDLTAPADSNGAYARFFGGGRRLAPALADGSTGSALAGGAGLIAAYARGGDPVWIVTGTDEAGVERAAKSLDRQLLKNRFALMIDQGGPRPLPEGARP